MQGSQGGSASGQQHRGRDQVTGRHPERVAEQKLLEPLRRLGRECEQRAQSDQPRDRHGGPSVGPGARISRREGDQCCGDDCSARGSEQQGRVGQPGEHQPGEESVRQRLRAVCESLAHHPEAERAAEAAREDELEHRAELDAAHRSSGLVPVLVVLDRDRAGGSRLVENDQLAPVGGLERGAVEHVAGRAERHLTPVQAEDEVERAGALHVVARHEQGAALAAQLREQAVDQRGAGRVDARERLVEEQHAGVLHERAGEQGALALAAGELAERGAGLVRQADAVERGMGRGAVGAPRRQPPASPGERAHEGHVERVDGEVQPGALRLGDVRGPPGHPDRPGGRLEIAQQRSEQRRLAAAVGAQHADGAAGVDAERHVAQDGRAAVAGGEVVHEDGGCRHRVAAAPNARTA